MKKEIVEKVEAAKQELIALPGVAKVKHCEAMTDLTYEVTLVMQDKFTIHCYCCPDEHCKAAVKNTLKRHGFNNCQVKYEYDKGLTDKDGNKIHWDPPA